MYLRMNRIKSGQTTRTYRSIAHNVWIEDAPKRRSRTHPIVFARLGAAEEVDEPIAHDLVVALARCFRFRGTGFARFTEVEQAAERVREIQDFLRVLVNPSLELDRHLPRDDQRISILEQLIRDRMADPTGSLARPAWLDSLSGYDH